MLHLDLKMCHYYITIDLFLVILYINTFLCWAPFSTLKVTLEDINKKINDKWYMVKTEQNLIEYRVYERYRQGGSSTPGRTGGQHGTTGSQRRAARGQRWRAEGGVLPREEAHLNRWVFRDDLKVEIESD